jgi:hypothetical protein
MTHEQLLKAARSAIEELFSDVSVDQDQIEEELEELLAEIESMIASLEDA